MNEKRLFWIAPTAILFTLLASAPAFATSVIGVEESTTTRSVQVTSDGAIVLESDEPFTELSIANPAIADISTLSSNAIYVLGKQPGRTTLMLMHENGSVMSMIEIRVTPDITELSRRLGEVLPGEPIEVLTAKDGLVLTGTVTDQAVVSKALELASHYAPGKISNLLSIRVVETAPEPAQPVKVEATPVDPAMVEAQLNELLPGEDISVHDLGGTIVLSGKVSSAEELQKALQIARLVAGDAEISNLMTVTKVETCKVRTRRGGEIIETDIPCRQDAAGHGAVAAPSIAPNTANPTPEGLASSTIGTSPLAPATSPHPRPRAKIG